MRGTNIAATQLQAKPSAEKSSGNSEPHPAKQLIPSVYNNAAQGPPQEFEVHHYKPLRCNAEYEETGNSDLEPRNDNVGSHHDGNNAQLINREISNVSDGYEVPISTLSRQFDN